MFQKPSSKGTACESTIFESHSLELLYDSIYESRLQSDLDDIDGEAGGKGKRRGNAKLQSLLKGSLSAARAAYAQGNPQGAAAAGARGRGGSAEGKKGDMLSKSLNELINSIANGSLGDTSPKMGRGTRFMNATAFAQDESATIGGNADDAAARAARLAAATAGMDADLAAQEKERREKEAEDREKEIEDLRSSIASNQSSLEDMDRWIANAKSKARQLDSDLAVLLAEGEALEKEIVLKKKTLEMLPMAAENISKLQAICGSSSERLLKLAQEWENHRVPLFEELRLKKRSKATRRTKCKQMVEDIKRFREDMVGMLQDLKDKQEKVQMLEEEKSKLPSNINRALYTRRIMDIIQSIGEKSRVTIPYHAICTYLIATY
jgi:predicted  nucleic acid-binding Zn-ribbon protein